MKIFRFFGVDNIPATAVSCLDITCATSGRGMIIMGDSEGHLIFIDRDFRVHTMQAHTTRITAIAQVKGTDIIVTVGDGADWRPAHVRAEARTAVLAARRTLQEQFTKLMSMANKKPPKRSDDNSESGNSDYDDTESQDADETEDIATSAFEGMGSANSLAAALGLNLHLSGAGSALDRGDSAWDAGSSLSMLRESDSSLHPAAQIKIWRRSHNISSSGPGSAGIDYTCIHTIRLFTPTVSVKNDRSSSGEMVSFVNAGIERAVTSIAICDDLKNIAVGCADGAVILLRGEFLANESSTLAKIARSSVLRLSSTSNSSNIQAVLLDELPELGPTSMVKPPIITAYSPPPKAITFLSFSVDESGYDASNAGNSGGHVSNMNRLVLFAVSPSSVRSYLPNLTKPVSAAGVPLPVPSTTSQIPPALAILHRFPSFSGSQQTIVSNLGSLLLPANIPEFTTLLDPNSGAIFGCSCALPDARIAVGSSDGVHLFSARSRAETLQLKGQKQAIAFNNGQISVVAANSTGAMSATLTVYDTRNQFVSLLEKIGGAVPAGVPPSMLQPPTVRFILVEWGLLFAFVSNGVPALPKPPTNENIALLRSGLAKIAGASATMPGSISGVERLVSGMLSVPAPAPAANHTIITSVLQLTEQDATERVRSLCKFDFFQLAETIALASHFDADSIAEIARRHGDRLLSRGDVAGAVVQYSKTIGVIEPSYVFRRLLGSTRISDLVVYLEELHRLGHAAGDHTTLLLNCYTKMKSVEKIRNFIIGASYSSIHSAPSSGAAKAVATTTTSKYVLAAEAVVKSNEKVNIPALPLLIPMNYDPNSTLSSLEDWKKDFDFDARIAASSLRDAGYIAEALFLSAKRMEHDLFLSILLEDLIDTYGLTDSLESVARAQADDKDNDEDNSIDIYNYKSTRFASYSAAITHITTYGADVHTIVSMNLPKKLRNQVAAAAAIAYISRLPASDAFRFLRAHGRALLGIEPVLTVVALLKLCSRRWKPVEPVLPSTSAVEKFHLMKVKMSEAAGKKVNVSLVENTYLSGISGEKLEPSEDENAFVPHPSSLFSLFPEKLFWLRLFCYEISKSNVLSTGPNSGINNSLLTTAQNTDILLSQSAPLRQDELFWSTYLDSTLAAGSMVPSTNPLETRRLFDRISSLLPSMTAPLNRWFSQYENMRIAMSNSSSHVGGEQQDYDSLYSAYLSEVAMADILKNRAAKIDLQTTLLICCMRNYSAGQQVLRDRGKSPVPAVMGIIDAYWAARRGGKLAEARSLKLEILRKAKSISDDIANGVLVLGSQTEAAESLADSGMDAAATAVGKSSAASTTNVIESQVWTIVIKFFVSLFRHSDGSIPQATLDATASHLRDLPDLVGRYLALELDEQLPLLTDAVLHTFKHDILSPLEILAFVSASPAIPLGAMRDLVLAALQKDIVSIAEEESDLEKLRADSKRMQSQMADLKEKPVIFQSETCAVCMSELNTPVVYFTCGGSAGSVDKGNIANSNVNAPVAGQQEHVFHMRCCAPSGSNSGISIPVEELECPICSSSQHYILSLRDALGPKPNLQENFFHEVSAAQDGFAKMAEYLSKGIFNGV